MSHAIQNLNDANINDLWETPQALLDEACKLYGVWPKLDVCATYDNQKCKYCFTSEDDALLKSWDYDFFMNPPFSAIAKWIEKAHHESCENNVTGIALIYARTDTKWWHAFIEGKAEVHFIQGRVRFEMDGRPSKHVAPFPSCWVIWRAKA